MEGETAVHEMVLGRNGSRASIAHTETRIWQIAFGRTHFASHQIPGYGYIEQVIVSATAITSCCVRNGDFIL